MSGSFSSSAYSVAARNTASSLVPKEPLLKVMSLATAAICTDTMKLSVTVAASAALRPPIRMAGAEGEEHIAPSQQLPATPAALQRGDSQPLAQANAAMTVQGDPPQRQEGQ